MAQVDRPGLLGLVGSLDWQHPLGVTRARATGHVQCYGAFLYAKLRHPKAVVLVRIGDFYTGVGFDALVLCQVCGLNPMAPHTGVAEAGFPKNPASLRRALNRLIEANYSVAMVEEVRSVSIGRRGERKERKLVGLVSASSPYYLYGDVEDVYDGDDTPLPKPIVAVSQPGTGGYRLLRYCPERRAILVLQQLSPEALMAHLHATGIAQPLFVHASLRRSEREAGGKSESVFRALVANLGVEVEEYGAQADAGRAAWQRAVGVLGPAPPAAAPGDSSPAAASASATGAAAVAMGPDVDGFRLIVVATMGMQRAEVEKLLVVRPEEAGWGSNPATTAPVPPSMATITQLGLAGARGVPSLLRAALPEGTPSACREWMRRLLLLPPPATVAEQIRTVCGVMVSASAPVLPPLVTSLPTPRLTALIGDCAAGHNTLREVQGMLCSVVALLRLPDSELLLGALCDVLAWSLQSSGLVSWRPLPTCVMAATCQDAADRIAAVVQLEGWAAGPATSSVDTDSELGDKVVSRQRWGAAAAAAAASAARGGGGGGVSYLRHCSDSELQRLALRLEGFRKAVRQDAMPGEVQRVEAARAAVAAALDELVVGLEAAQVGPAAELKLAPHDDAVWLRLLGKAGIKMPAAQQKSIVQRVRQASGLELVHPTNRKRAVEGERYSTQRLEACTAKYAAAAEAADKKARQLLRDLCGSLRPQLPVLLAANELSVLAGALVRHAQRAKEAGWNWPDMPPAHTLKHGAAEQQRQPHPMGPPQAQAQVATSGRASSPFHTFALTGTGGGPAGRNVWLSLPGLWPYWMDRRDAVLNDLRLSAGSMALLTGPNMAGKSTVLRSVAAAALLATCGMAVPAGSGEAHRTVATDAMSAISSAAAPPAGSGWGLAAGGPLAAPYPLEVSWLSHVSLRNFSGDSPLEGKSAFAVEMEDTASTLAVARGLGPRCLVLLDELGKGTEVAAGSALGAAVVEALAAARVGGVFATHLHDLPFLLQGLAREGGLKFWAMEVAPDRGRAPQGLLTSDSAGWGEPAAAPPPEALLRPTHRVLMDQICLRSLALAVAAQCGMPPELLRAAAAHEARLRAMLADARQQAYGGSHVPLYGLRVWDGVGEGAGDAVWGKAGQGQVSRPRGGNGCGGGWGGAAGWGTCTTGVQEEELGAAADAGMLLLPPLAEQHRQQVQEAQQQQELVQQQVEEEVVLQQESVQQLQLSSAPPAADPAPALGGLRDVPLDEAAGVLRAVLLAALATHTPEGLKDTMTPELGKLHFVQPDYVPPRALKGEACVYVLRTWQQQLYVGETEDIGQRLATHRATETRERRRLQAAAEPLPGARRTSQLRAVYALVPRSAGGRSTAQDVEAELIAALQAAGANLRSAHDKRRAMPHGPSSGRGSRRAAAAGTGGDGAEPEQTEH